MESFRSADEVRYQRMTTEELKSAFLIEQLFETDIIRLVYSDIDRAITGSAAPVMKKLELSVAAELASDFFTQRRELGVINIGQAGSVIVDKEKFALSHLDGLYIGRGSKRIEFSNDDAKSPALFYLLSYPAHKDYPTTHIKLAEAEPVHLGSMEESNERTIYKYIHPDGVKSCQLVMGLTKLKPGSVWNTMPAHTHPRRMEVYFYFDLPEDAVVFHLMGQPEQTRHIVIRNQEAVVSPSWSIHSGVGTSNYTFIWGMGGENQEFGDMSHVSMEDLA
ncbi:5-dehydro-4-deoxy-D-glucuronate isomerase [Candidatus Neomarinimicrobiota bacterium]